MEVRTPMNTMLIHDFAYVPVSADKVRDRILADHGGWLAPLASAAAGTGEALRLRVRPVGGAPDAGQDRERSGRASDLAR